MLWWRKTAATPVERYATPDVISQVRSAANQLRDVYDLLEPALQELEQRFPADPRDGDPRAQPS